MSNELGHRRTQSWVDQLSGLSDPDKIVALEKLVREKEAQIIQAAQMGKNLLTELGETKKKLSALTSSDLGQQYEQRLGSLQSTLEAKEEELRALREHYEGREAEEGHARAALAVAEQQRAELGKQIQAGEKHASALQEQLEEYELRINELNEAIAALKAEVEKLKRFEGKAMREARESSSELEAAKAEANSLREQLEELQKLENKRLQDARKMEQQIALLSTEIADLRVNESGRKDASTAQLQKLKEALAQAQAEAASQKLELEALRQSEVKLKSTVSALTRENRDLLKDSEQNLTFLNEARASVNVLLAKQVEHHAITEGQADAASVDPMMDNSLLGELEKELSNRLQHQPQGEPIKQAQNKTGFSGEEEYFFWLLSAIKTSLIMKNPHHSDGVCLAQPRTLYQEAKAIDYYEWHHWIEERLLSLISVKPLPSSFKPTPLPSSSTSSSSNQITADQLEGVYNSF